MVLMSQRDPVSPKARSWKGSPCKEERALSEKCSKGAATCQPARSTLVRKGCETVSRGRQCDSPSIEGMAAPANATMVRRDMSPRPR